jgi:hypothetical protein
MQIVPTTPTDAPAGTSACPECGARSLHDFLTLNGAHRIVQYLGECDHVWRVSWAATPSTAS